MNQRWRVLAAGAFALVSFGAACGGSQAPRQQLDADPPVGGDEAASKGASSTEVERAIAYIKNEKYADAKGHLEKALALKPDNAEAAYYLGLAREKTGDRPGAEQSYKQALASDPKLVDAAMNIAALYLEEPLRPDEAIEVLTKALAAAPDHAGLHTNLALAYGMKHDVASSSKHYEAALKAGDSALLRLGYGAMLLEAKETDKAAAELKKALAAAGDDAAMLASIGRMLGPAKAYADCVAAFDRAIKLKPGIAELYVRRGTCRHELKDEEGARSDYQAAIKADPTFAAAHYYLGLSFFGDKKPQSALAAMQQAAKLGGDGDIGKRAQAKVKEITALLKNR